MEGNWIKIHRKIVEWEWYKTPGMVQLWIHLLVSANWEDKRFQGEIIPRGSLITGRKKLAEQTGLSEQQIRTCLRRLEETQNLTIKSTNKFSVITISKYDDYQAFLEDGQPAAQPTTNQQLTNNQPQSKNIRNKENNNKQTNAPAREDWRFVSSVVSFSLGNDKDKIANYKRDSFANEVAQFSPELGMTPSQQTDFIRYWTEHSPGSDKIRAEYELTFDIKSRMSSWIARDAQKKRPEQSRMDKYKENMKYIYDYFNGQQQSTIDDQ